MPELDGVRGVAVLLVLVGHLAEVEWMAVAGVTLFFGLSGYLITGLLVAERERTGGVDLRAFYVRRVRRLVPALVAAVAGTGILMALVGHLGSYPGQALAALGYAANLARAAGSDLGPLGHTWSLALEEQFYALWPAAFLLVPRRWLAPAVAIAVAASLAVWAGAHGDAEYAPAARAWAVLAGCLLAVTVGRVRLPGILAAYPLRRAGELSYALYLWHFPLVWMLGWAMGGRSWPVMAAVAAASLLLALASERWVERPFRLRHHEPVRDEHDRVQIAGGAGLGRRAEDGLAS